MVKTKFKTFKGRQGAVDSIMKKYYPSSTVVPTKTYRKRYKEFTELFKKKGLKQVINKAKEYKKQWERDN